MGWGTDPIVPAGAPAWGNDPIVPAMKFSDDAIAKAKKGGARVVYMSPDQYLALSPKLKDETFGDRKGKELLSSVEGRGEAVDEVPSLAVAGDKVTGQDGRHRALLARQNGLDRIPVAVTGDLKSGWVTGMDGAHKIPAWELDPEMKRPTPKRAVPVDVPEGAQPSTVAGRIGTGMMDPAIGLGQIAGHLGVDKLNQWIDKLGVPGVPKAVPMDEAVRAREAAYQASRRAAGSEGFDWSRTAGNVLSPVTIATGAVSASSIPASLAGRVVGGAAMGGGMGAMSPVVLEPGATEGDFWKEKGKQTGVGVAAGGLVPMAAGGVSRIVSPQTSAEVKALRDAGVQLTPGQVAGGWLRGIEEKLKSVPIMGDIIKASERRATEDFNRVAIDRSLDNIGQKLPKGVQMGHEAIEHADNQISSAYDALLGKMKGKIDAPLVSELKNVVDMGAAGLPKERAEQLGRLVDREVLGRFTPEGNATGETLKQIDSKLGGEIRRMMRSDDYDVRNMGAALTEVKKSVRSMLTRANPTEAPDLAKIDRAYAEFQRVQVAAARQGAKDGLFTPAQLRSAVRELDPTMRKKAFSKGTALMQDLAESGEKVLSPTIPDSGTAGRALAAGALANPALAGTVGLASALPMSLLYSRMGQSVINPLLASRPQWAPAAAKAIEGAAPYATVPMVNMAGQLAK